MGRKRKGRRRVDSSSSDVSSSDKMSTAEASLVRRSLDSVASPSEVQRNTRLEKDKGIKQMLKEMKEMRKQLMILSATVKHDSQETRKELKKLTESHNKLRRQLVHTTVSSGDDSAAPRSGSQQVQLPRYRLVFQCAVNDEIEKEKSIETKEHGKEIRVALLDDQDQIVKTQPLASATVMLVVVNGEFNQHGNQYNWHRKDFERNIKRPQQGNSATVYVNQSIQSIVTNCVFKLDHGFQSHTGATIQRNSSNKKVKLGVMVLSPTEERVLEGLSNSFFVRGHDRHYNSKRQKQARSGYDYEDQERNGTNTMVTMQNPSCPIMPQPGESRFNSIAALNTSVFSPQPLISQEPAPILQDQFSHSMVYGTSRAQATNCITSTHFIDQLMPLYNCQPHVTEHLGLLPFPAKDVMQTSIPQKKGVLVEPPEGKNRLRFVTKAREAYYTRESSSNGTCRAILLSAAMTNRTPSAARRGLATRRRPVPIWLSTTMPPARSSASRRHSFSTGATGTRASRRPSRRRNGPAEGSGCQFLDTRQQRRQY